MMTTALLPIIAVLLMIFILAFVIDAAMKAQQSDEHQRELMELLNSQATMLGEWFDKEQNKKGN